MNEWSATPQAFKEGCFKDVVCYDSTGGFWPIVNATLAEHRSPTERLFPWKQTPIKLHFGPRSQATLKEVVSKLVLVLTSESEFNDVLVSSPTKIINQLENADGPMDIICIARECVKK